MNKESKAKFKIGDSVYVICPLSDEVSSVLIRDIRSPDAYIVSPIKEIAGISVASFHEDELFCEEELYKTLEEVTIIHGQDGIAKRGYGS